MCLGAFFALQESENPTPSQIIDFSNHIHTRTITEVKLTVTENLVGVVCLPYSKSADQ